MAFCFEFPSLFSFLFMLLDKSHCLCLCQAQGEPKLVHFEGFSLQNSDQDGEQIKDLNFFFSGKHEFLDSIEEVILQNMANYLQGRGKKTIPLNNK